MQTVRIPTAVHDPSRLFINDFHLVVHENIVHVLFEQGIRLEQLIHGMHTRTLDTIVSHELAFHLKLGLLFARTVVDRDQFRRQIRHGEKVVVLHIRREVLDSFFSQFHLILLLVDDKIQLFICLRHLALIVLQVEPLGFQKLLFHALSAQEFNQCLGFGQGAKSAKQSQSTFGYFILACALFGQELFCIG